MKGPVVEAGGADAGVEMSVLVPLETALEINGGAGWLLIGLALVEIAKLVGGVADLVALGIAGQQLLQQQLGAPLIIDEIVAETVAAFPAHRFGVQRIRFRDVLAGL